MYKIIVTPETKLQIAEAHLSVSTLATLEQVCIFGCPEQPSAELRGAITELVCQSVNRLRPALSLLLSQMGGAQMTKGELRKLREQARAEGRAYNIENECGHLEIVRTRTKGEERRHQIAMYRWTRRNYEDGID